jgi:hypothetical protein
VLEIRWYRESHFGKLAKMKSKFHIFGFEISFSKIIAFIVSGTLLGLCAEIGKDLYNLLKAINKDVFNEAFTRVENVAFYEFKINVISASIFIVLFIPIYRFIDKRILSRLISEVVFFDDFDKATYAWILNYWGSTNPEKTNRIQNGCMVFEANQNEWPSRHSENGAFLDLSNGIIEGLNYTIKCKVKSSLNSTMGFRLWVHDVKGSSTITNPIAFETPPSDDYKEYSLAFKATETNAIRVHLHCKAGAGFLMVDSVKVIRGK